jgi:isopenicillin-N N-acyltransferase like protein
LGKASDAAIDPIRGIKVNMRWRVKLVFTLMYLLAVGCAEEARPAPMASIAPPPVLPPRLAIPVGEFSGDPAQIGAEHGNRFHDQIIDLFQNYLMPRLPGNVRVQARMAAASFEIFMLPEQRAETRALADAVGLNVYDAVLGQCYLDLMPLTGCSTIALPSEAAPDGVARMGRNLDFDAGGVLQKRSVLIVYHPVGKYQFASIGWPGMIGVLSGMNEYGLCLANMEVDRPFRPPMAMPYTLLYRTVLEQCRTVDEAIDLLKRTPRQSANNLMLMDARGDRAVAEIRPDGVAVRHGQSGTGLISTNHQRGQDADTPGYCWRYDSLHTASASEFGRIDLPTIEGMLAKVVQGTNGDMTLQSMVFEPATRVIYLATGLNAPGRPYERIDLKYYFGERNQATIAR